MEASHAFRRRRDSRTDVKRFVIQIEGKANHARYLSRYRPVPSSPRLFLPRCVCTPNRCRCSTDLEVSSHRKPWIDRSYRPARRIGGGAEKGTELTIVRPASGRGSFHLAFIREDFQNGQGKLIQSAPEFPKSQAATKYLRSS